MPTANPPQVDLAPFQGAWNGLVFGEGTPFVVTENIDGLLAYESRISDQPLPSGDGDIPFARYAAGRFVTIAFAIAGPPLSSELEARVAQWWAAFDASDPYLHEWLLFRLMDRVIVVRARVARRKIDTAPESSKTGVVRATVELKIADPRIYGTDPSTGGRHSALIPIGPASGGGFDLTAEIPLDMAAAVGGSAILVNDGNAPAHGILRIANAGPGNVTEISVLNATTGVTVEFLTTLLPGQTLTADFESMMRAEQGPYIYIGDVSRFSDWQHPRNPLYLAPGENILTADVTGGAATIRFDWLDTNL